MKKGTSQSIAVEYLSLCCKINATTCMFVCMHVVMLQCVCMYMYVDLVIIYYPMSREAWNEKICSYLKAELVDSHETVSKQLSIFTEVSRKTDFYVSKSQKAWWWASLRFGHGFTVIYILCSCHWINILLNPPAIALRKAE